jgi:hypothetical protein
MGTRHLMAMALDPGLRYLRRRSWRGYWSPAESASGETDVREASDLPAEHVDGPVSVTSAGTAG